MSRPKKLINEPLLIAMNMLGYSLFSISRVMKCHPSTVTNRLRDLGIPAIDTRHSFMEDIIEPMPDVQKEWVLDQLSNKVTIKTYVRDLINKDYQQRNQTP